QPGVSLAHRPRRGAVAARRVRPGLAPRGHARGLRVPRGRRCGPRDPDQRGLMAEDLVVWHDFNVALVTAAAGLLGLLFVALSIHVRTLTARRNAELRSIARSIFLGYVVSLGIGFLALMPQTLTALGGELLVLVLAA